MQPMLSLGQLLGASGQCGACMDNTDGIGQSLSELSEASKCAFVIRAAALKISPVVEQLSRVISVRPLDMVFDGGADFSLVGTLHGTWTSESASARFNHPLEIIGIVESGQGVWSDEGQRTPLAFRGWNYFSAHSQ
jgi:thiamine monophosphate kinase